MNEKNTIKNGYDSMKLIPRMRTANAAMEEIRVLDPNTSITPYYIRCLIRSGSIPVVHAGRKCLLNMDMLLDYLGMERDICD